MSSPKCPTNEYGFPLCARLIGGVPDAAKTTLDRLKGLRVLMDAEFDGHIPPNLQRGWGWLHDAVETLITTVAQTHAPTAARNTGFEERIRAEHIRPQILGFLSSQPGRCSNSRVIQNWLDYVAMPLPHDEVCRELRLLECRGKVALYPPGDTGDQLLGVHLVVEPGDAP